MPLRRRKLLKRKKSTPNKRKAPLKRLWVKKLDEAWSTSIRGRDRKCVRCGSVNHLQAAHIFSRRRRTTRWELLNGIALCYACHIYWAHREPIDFNDFIKARLGEVDFDMLKQMANRIDAPLTLERYQDTLSTLQSSSENYEEVKR